MEYDTERAKQKTDELVDVAQEALLNYWKSVGFEPDPHEAIETFCYTFCVTAPSIFTPVAVI